MKKLLVLLTTLFAGFAFAQTKEGEVRFPAEAFFMKVENVEQDRARNPFHGSEYEPDQFCVALPGGQIRAVTAYKNDVLVVYKRRPGNSLARSLWYLQCPESGLLFVSQKRWLEIPLSEQILDDKEERFKFVQQARQKIRQDAVDAETARIAALPQVCRDQDAFVANWTAQERVKPLNKKEVEARQKENMRLDQLCEEQKEAQKK